MPEQNPQPVFIVRVGDKYYLTREVWEYDKAAAKTDEQIDGFEQILNLFRNSPHTEAAMVPQGHASTAADATAITDGTAITDATAIRPGSS